MTSKVPAAMFNRAVTEAVSNFPEDYRSDACPDQYVGIISEFTDHMPDFPCRIDSLSATGAIGRVILILESPHKREFVAPVGPAKGTTGRLIRQHLHEILKGHCVDDWELYLFNAIQNQCSLGRSTDKYRDAVFRCAWRIYGEHEFVSRLRALATSKTIVIDACTKTDSPKGEPLRRVIVERAVCTALGRPSDIRITHPASWALQANRRAFW